MLMPLSAAASESGCCACCWRVDDHGGGRCSSAARVRRRRSGSAGQRRGEGLADRSSRPHRSPRRTPAAVEQAVLRARPGVAPSGPHLLGWALGLAASTVHAILRRHGCSRLSSRSRAARSSATSASGRASSSTSTSRSSAGSSNRATASPATARPHSRQPAGSTCSSAIDDASRLGFAAHLPGRDR